MIDARTAILVGAAVGGPWLLAEGAAAGIPIPAYVTDAQRAAVASLQRTIAGQPVVFSKGNLQTFARANELKLALPTYSPSQLVEILDAFIAAAKAGVDAGGDPPYEVVAGQEAIDGFVAGAAWSMVVDGDDAPSGITALGTAIREAQAEKTNIFTRWPVPVLEAWKKVVALAVEMDDVGFLITGKPFKPTIGGGLEAAAKAVEGFVAGVAGDAAGAAANALAGLMLSTPGLVLLGGLVLWKVAHR